MNLTHIESFYHVARLHSFSAAAEYLDVSKGMISRHIKALETAMNTQLFHRTTRVVTLSAAGEQLWLRAEKIMQLAYDAQQSLSDEQYGMSGTLRFTAPINLGERIIKDILPDFIAQCPEVNIELNFSQTMRDIEHGEQDIALRSHLNHLPDNVVAHRIGYIKNILVASPNYLNTQPAIKQPSDLSQHQCLPYTNAGTQDTWHLQKGDTQYDVAIVGRQSAFNYSTILILAQMDVGIGNVPLFYSDHLIAAGKLTPVLPSYHSALHQLSIIHARYRRLPKKITLFKQHLVNWFIQHDAYIIQ